MHPANFLIDKQITTQPLKEYPTANLTYTDALKNDGTGSVFCCFDDRTLCQHGWASFQGKTMCSKGTPVLSKPLNIMRMLSSRVGIFGRTAF
ncbi:hypothetical protein AVEN_51726-1 [Araneus ventricosus]|uniref:Uncharacterized protein n=1 Tax=Araneus ventricosus TaxID=182803 RepID=A0A4Y2GJS6_ARAVE|nr:hypothetical protein AVEN_51726-1 [Araneus ventricosus]